MKNNIKNELQALRADMGKNQLEPEHIVVDNQWHTYPVKINGISRQAIYIATQDPLEKDPNGPVLVCAYGLTDEKQIYNYSSQQEK